MKATITLPFEIDYDRKSRELTLKHVETPSGRQAVIRFDAQATRVFYECIVEIAMHCG